MYDLSVYLKTFDLEHLTLDDIQRSNQGQITFKFGMKHTNHICSVLSVYLMTLTMDDIERLNQGHWVSNGLCFINHAGYEPMNNMYICVWTSYTYAHIINVSLNIYFKHTALINKAFNDPLPSVYMWIGPLY